MGRTLITGATGLIGQRLLPHLEKPVALVRDPQRSRAKLPGTEVHRWEASEGLPPSEALEGVDSVVHLMGEPIAGGRWTKERKERMWSSRVESTRTLVQAIALRDPKPKVLLCASAVGYYGSRGDEELTEESRSGDDFLARMSAAWELEAAAARTHGLRVASVRIGLVLDPDGGVLGSMLPPFRLGLGTVFGSGKQWMSWIHHEDMTGILRHVLTTDTIDGPVNAVSPNPAPNRAFSRALASAIGRPLFLSVPTFALELGMGEMAAAVLASTRATPKAALDSGYRFRYPDLDAAFESLGL